MIIPNSLYDLTIIYSSGMSETFQRNKPNLLFQFAPYDNYLKYFNNELYSGE